MEDIIVVLLIVTPLGLILWLFLAYLAWVFYNVYKED